MKQATKRRSQGMHPLRLEEEEEEKKEEKEETREGEVRI
jgi:hypothetical protein